MSNIHAAIGYSQIINLKKIIKKKIEIHKFYQKNFKSISGLNLLTQSKNCISNYWLNVLKVDEKIYGRTKEELIKYLLSNGVEVRSVWYPNHLQKPYKKFENYKISKSLELFKKSICLPSSFSLTLYQLKFIVKLFKNYEKKKLIII